MLQTSVIGTGWARISLVHLLLSVRFGGQPTGNERPLSEAARLTAAWQGSREILSISHILFQNFKSTTERLTRPNLILGRPMRPRVLGRWMQTAISRKILPPSEFRPYD